MERGILTMIAAKIRAVVYILKTMLFAISVMDRVDGSKKTDAGL